jgi:hypothetical protein
MAIAASLSRLETTVDLILPSCMQKIGSAGSPWKKTRRFFGWSVRIGSVGMRLSISLFPSYPIVRLTCRNE